MRSALEIDMPATTHTVQCKHGPQLKPKWLRSDYIDYTSDYIDYTSKYIDDLDYKTAPVKSQNHIQPTTTTTTTTTTTKRCWCR